MYNYFKTIELHILVTQLLEKFNCIDFYVTQNLVI